MKLPFENWLEEKPLVLFCFYAGSCIVSPIALMLALTSCVPMNKPIQPVPYAPDPADNTDPYPDDDAIGASRGDECALAGRTLWRLRCPEWKPKDGRTFPAFCRNAGALVETTCIAHASTRTDVRTCNVECRGSL